MIASVSRTPASVSTLRYAGNALTRLTPLVFSLALTAFAQQQAFRPPAVPLVAHDPYLSIWSMSDRLTDENTKHWTGTEQALGSLIRIDGVTFRVMGRDPRAFAALPQQSVEVLPTRTIYNFEGSGVHLQFTFLTPALPRDLEILSRPVTYLIWTANAVDGKPHDVAVYLEAAASLAVNTADQPVEWSRFRLDGMDALRLGSQQQPVLEKDGDNLRIDWGYLYLAAPADAHAGEAAAGLNGLRTAFAASGKVPVVDDTEPNRPAGARGAAGLAVSVPMGNVGATPVSRHLLLAYDDLWSLTYLERRVRPYWRRNGATAADLLL